MTINRVNNILTTGLSAVDGRAIATLSHIDGQALVAGTSGNPLYYSEPRMKPSGYGINYNHPMAAGIKSLVLFNENTLNTFDIARSAAVTAQGAAVQTSNTEGGCGSTPTTTGRYQIVNSLASDDFIGTGPTTIAVIRRKFDTTLRVSSLFGVNQTPGVDGVRCGTHCPFSDGTVYWDYGGASGANRLTWAGYVPSIVVEKWVFVAGSNGSAIYFNGQLAASQATGISRTLGGNNFWIGDGNSIASGVTDLQDYNYFACFAAQWAAGDVEKWATNPYCFLQQPAYLYIT